ncbi:MAG: hypothetical protein ABIR96_06110 [Bdellovibrionota bacterium]
MNNAQYWSLNGLLCLSVFSAMHLWESAQKSRRPASDESISLEIKEIQLPSNSKVQEFRNVSLRATFNHEKAIDLLPGRTLQLRGGQVADLNVKIPVDPSWIRNDQLAFNLEFVEQGMIEVVVVRCAQVSKKISSYNRNYQCFIPGDTVALVTYRLGNEHVGVSALAQK